MKPIKCNLYKISSDTLQHIIVPKLYMQVHKNVIQIYGVKQEIFVCFTEIKR